MSDNTDPRPDPVTPAGIFSALDPIYRGDDGVERTLVSVNGAALHDLMLAYQVWGMGRMLGKDVEP